MLAPVKVGCSELQNEVICLHIMLPCPCLLNAFWIDKKAYHSCLMKMMMEPNLTSNN